MRRDLEGCRVLITGAMGGIGVAATDALRMKGANVAGIDLVAGPGVEQADVRDRMAVVDAVTRVVARLGGLDILINNAGIGRAHDAGDFPDDEARAVMDTNFFGTWNMTAAALPHLLRSHGQVINVSSGLALVDVPYAVAYAASKRAVVTYSAALRLEYGDRLTVGTVYPGYIRTRIHDRAAASGATLEGLVRADTVEGAAAAIVRTCLTARRSATSSTASSIELWLAGRFPTITERVLARRFRRWRSRMPVPDFVRFQDDSRD